MRLEIDVGNTFVKWRWVSDGTITKALRCLKEPFLSRIADIDEPELVLDELCDIWIGSVAGREFNEALTRALKTRWDITPLFAVSASSAADVRNSYIEPTRMGVDRWLAMLAARHQDDGASTVVDCGSAITIDYLSAQGEHLGGYIVPGLQMMRASLLNNTANVRYDDEDLLSIEPGKHTGACVNNGTRYLLQALAGQLLEEASKSGSQLYITGGDGYLLQAQMPGALLVPDLVLDGLMWADKQ